MVDFLDFREFLTDETSVLGLFYHRKHVFSDVGTSGGSYELIMDIPSVTDT